MGVGFLLGFVAGVAVTMLAGLAWALCAISKEHERIVMGDEQ